MARTASATRPAMCCGPGSSVLPGSRWTTLVLATKHAGQAAIVLADGVTTDNIFYRLCPTPLLMPMIVPATGAPVTPSQSIITGAFSMTRQAIQLGWFPRLKITQTSAEGYGQIYEGPANWMLMVVTIAR